MTAEEEKQWEFKNLDELKQYIFELINEKAEDEWINEAINTYAESYHEMNAQQQVKNTVSDEEIGQLFENNSDCYADTRKPVEFNPHQMVEGDVVMAMTKERFIKVVRDKLTTPTEKSGSEIEKELIKYSNWLYDNTDNDVTKRMVERYLEQTKGLIK